MSAVSALPAQIVEWLSGQSHLTDVTFMTEFPAVKKAIPLRKNIVAIGLSEVLIEDKFVENDEGILIKQEHCRSAKLRVTLAVHVPFSKGGHTCHDVFSRIVDSLNFASDLQIESSGCEQITADRNTDALVLNGYVLITADFCPAATSDHNFPSFMDKELLCGSHIRNSEIHVTKSDKEKWDNPFRTGTYSGTGSGSRTISLGYTPSYVSVFALEYPCAEYNQTTGKTMLYTAYASQRGGSLGVEIVSNGFHVTHGPVSFGASTPQMNASGVLYGYVALK